MSTEERLTQVDVRASFVIPTRDRIEELRQLLRSLQAQTVPVEMLVMDDSETQAAGAMLAAEFPAARYFRLGSNRGPAFQRNRGIELASAEFVFPVDDDTVFPSPRTVEQTLEDFSDPAIGVVAIPYVNVRHETFVRQSAPGAGRIHLCGLFVGAAHAVRRSHFLRVHGFREEFFYMGEEGDLCIRLYEQGIAVRLGSAEPMHHLESPIRNFERADRFGSRNHVLFVWQNVPMPFLIPHLIATTLKIMLHSLRPKRLATRGAGILEAYASMFRGSATRAPVRAGTFRAFRSLVGRPMALEEVRLAFPGLLR